MSNIWSYRASIALLIVLAYVAISQDTTSKQGCTFGDEKNIYNIELLPGQYDVACPSSEAQVNLGLAAESRADELHESALYLQQMADTLEASNHQLWDKIHYLNAEINKLKQEIVKRQALNKCPPGYELHSDTYKSCYMFVARYFSWYFAESYCMSTGGHLVALETEEEQDFLVQYISAHSELPGKHFWIGGNDIARENEWMWAGVNVPINYTRWLLYPHQEHGPVQMPDNHLGLEHCVHLFHLHDYDWNDLYCSNRHYFACEYKLV